jgi:hypothetical protein
MKYFETPESLSKALVLLPGIFDEAIPISYRQRKDLRRTIRSLWEDLTSEKEHRTSEYLSSPAYSSSYIRYFLPWNIIRLSSVLTQLPFSIEQGSTIADIGSGPLTLPISLYISRPELRTKALTIYCTDKTERILKQGLVIFENLCVRLSGSLPPWKILLLRQSFGTGLPEKVDLLTAANVFNEFFWKSKEPLAERAAGTARLLKNHVKEQGQIFLLEPGDPRSGSFIAAVRSALLTFGVEPLAPCPHTLPCPLPGMFRSIEHKESPMAMPKRRDKYPWCHFTIPAVAAPHWLRALSEDAGLPKEKLVFSFLLAALNPPGQKPKETSSETPNARIISEAFYLPGGAAGRYACSYKGYSLVRYDSKAKTLESGDLIPVKEPSPQAKEVDEKSGAIILSY